MEGQATDSFTGPGGEPAADPSTEVLDRQSFDPVLEREWKLARRGAVASILLVADVDRHPRLDDGEDHSDDDRALRLAGMTLAACCRSTDIVARIAGAEFAVVLVGTTGEQPTPYVRRVTERLAGDARAPTLSFGWSKLATATSPEHAIDLATGLLYRRRAVSKLR